MKFLDVIGFWYILKTVIWIIAGETLIKPVARDIKDEFAKIPRILHYLDRHPGKSWKCHECNLEPPRHEVDSLS
jgi:hypothetical protein